jgi:hypothetical protein
MAKHWQATVKENAELDSILEWLDAHEDLDPEHQQDARQTA